MAIDKDVDPYLNFKDYASEMYLGYSIAVLKERAIPYLSDGQKPVQRRILFAMRELGIKADLPPKKSARVVGDVIGKYHPHGDSSVYEAMVRMSQEWNLRYPLVDGQGNFGSRDGDGAAAMRYTEARLTPLAEAILLSELKLGTVDWRENYDNTIEEPSNLPSRLNMMLLNGATGIAVGMASDVPSHNMRELTNVTLKVIGNSKITHEEIMEELKGPDFPGGGQIIDDQETINEIYKSGRGTLKVRARWTIEKKARGQWQVVINEFPPNLSSTKILESIHKITNPIAKKDSKGKPKQLPQKVLAEKNYMLSILDSAKDDSDKSTPVRFVLVPKSSRMDPEEFMNALIGRIGLDQTSKVNLTTVCLDGQPQVKSIKDLILEWIAYRFETMTRRTTFQLNKVQSRIHILDGRMLAFLNIDQVIDIIRNAEYPKSDLMREINVTEIQAEDILDIKLRQLAKLEGMKIENELAELKKEETKLLALLGSRTKMNNLMKKEIEADTLKFEDERRTILKPAKTIVAKSADAVADEPVTIILTKKGWLTLRKGHNVDISTIQLKDDDEIRYIEEGRSVQALAMVASNGRVFSVKPTDVPSGKGGFSHLNSIIEIGASSVVSMTFTKDQLFMIYNNDGYGFISNAKNLESKNKAGKHFMSLPNADSVILPFIKINPDQGISNMGSELTPEMVHQGANDWVTVVTTDDRMLCFTVEEMLGYKQLDKGKGYQLVKLPTGVQIKQLIVSDPEKTSFKDGRKKINLLDNKDSYLSNRAKRGRKVPSDINITYEDE
jgi:topoisomerase-4 subunit A